MSEPQASPGESGRTACGRGEQQCGWAELSAGALTEKKQDEWMAPIVTCHLHSRHVQIRVGRTAEFISDASRDNRMIHPNPVLHARLLPVIAWMAFFLSCTPATSPPPPSDRGNVESTSKVVYEVAQRGAYVYESDGMIAVCFGKMGPPFASYTVTEFVREIDDETPRSEWWREKGSPADWEVLSLLLQNLAKARRLVYVDLANLPATDDQIAGLKYALPSAVVHHGGK